MQHYNHAVRIASFIDCTNVLELNSLALGTYTLNTTA